MSVTRRQWLGLFFLSLGVAMIIVDATIVNVAIPQIIRDLGITSTTAQWVQEVYTLVFAALLLTFGRFADRLGRRRLFVAGVLVFVAASVLAALSQSGAQLVGARVVQGIGGAAMLPTSLSLLNATFRGRERGIAFAVWGSTIGGSAALGPLLGGWLTTTYSWRWAFGINVPVGIAVLTGVALCISESRDRSTRPGADWWGAVLSVVGFGGVVFGLIEGRNYGWWHTRKALELGSLTWSYSVSPVPVAITVGVAALAVFAVVELRRNRSGRVVLLDLRLFAIPSFRNGNLTAAVVSLGEFGLIFSLPLWFQNVHGYTAFQTGLALLPLAVGSFVASGFGGQLAQRRGAVLVVRTGIVLEIVGVAAIGVALRPDGAWWSTVPWLFVYGMGVGLATAQLTGVILIDVPVDQSGQGSGTQSTARQIGSALGIAILGSVLFVGLGLGLRSQIEQHQPHVPPVVRDRISNAVVDSAGAAIAGLERNPRTRVIAEEARTSFTDAARYAAWSAAAFLTIGLLASLSLGSSGDRPADRASEVSAS